MMARQVARQFCRLREVHSSFYGRRAGSENGRKLTASTPRRLAKPPNELSGFNALYF